MNIVRRIYLVLILATLFCGPATLAQSSNYNVIVVLNKNVDSPPALLSGPDAHFYQSFGLISARVNKATLEKLALLPEVKKVLPNGWPSQTAAFNEKWGDKKPPEKIEDLRYNFTSIGMAEVLKQVPWLTGRGARVGVIDTGIDGGHSSLRDKVIKFFDAQTGKVSPPKEYDRVESHGTHVSGIIAGGNFLNEFVGLAPDAGLVVASATEKEYANILSAMEWFLKDGGVRVVNCSWNSNAAPDQEPFYRALDAWKQAGILAVFSAGNKTANRGGDSILYPHAYPDALTVGSFGSDGLVSSFSGRGPGHYRGETVQKPDLVAPGADILSTVVGGFAELSGTSQAAPHVTGAIALLMQVNPKLKAQDLKAIILKSLEPGFNGQKEWNPDYGFGKLNVWKAVQLAQASKDQSEPWFITEFLRTTEFLGNPL